MIVARTWRMGIEDVEKVVDQAWTSLLLSVMKKREILRPEMGDEIDLYLPQSRLLSLIASQPGTPKLVYLAAHASAERNARSIVKRLGMPADYFWKFEYWPKARAMTSLGQIVKRVFSSMMTLAKEGNLELIELDVDPLRISIDFEGCVECAGIGRTTQGICYYHAGVFSGILSGLINHTLDGIETACYATGSKSCRFLVGDRDDKNIKVENEAYLSHISSTPDLASRLEDSLRQQPTRALGNFVDVNYYRLVVANALLSDPQHPQATNFELGSQLGRKMASVLARYYGRQGLENAIEYYSQLRGFKAEVKGDDRQKELVITDCAETAGAVKTMEMLSFLGGELQGMTSELTGTDMTLKESRFEGEKLVLVLIAKQ